MIRFMIAALLVATALAAEATEAPQTTVKIGIPLPNQGTIEGVRETMGNASSSSRFFFSYRGIPYAAPPVGDLRFQEPASPEPWNEVRESMTPPPCPQISYESILKGEAEVIGDEDCLYLHVYTPKPYPDDLPVMVYIHGGGFHLGDADNLGGTPVFLLREDIVLVSIQYRLGTLGFLSTGDSVLPGNLGLKDQTLALRWVQDNIHHFGGDPNKVTVFGESAGSASTHYQILTPYSEGLFQRAILQSGTTLNPWAFRDDHAERALTAAKRFGCPSAEDPSPNSTLLLECFKERPLEELVVESVMDTTQNVPLYMVPRADGDYIPAHPAQLLREGRHHKVDLMSGVCQNEGAGIIISFFLNETLKDDFLANFDVLGPAFFGTDNEDNSVYLARRMLYHYVGDFDLAEEDVVELEKLNTESFMGVGHDATTALHARDAMYGKRTYRFELQHRPVPSIGDIYNYSTDLTKDWVSHGDDVLFLFGSVAGLPELTRPKDIFLSDIMVSLWTNFAKTGDPTPDLELGFKWDAMTSEDDMRFLSLTPAPMMKEDNRDENREFLSNLPLKVNKMLSPDMFTCSTDVCPR